MVKEDITVRGIVIEVYYWPIERKIIALLDHTNDPVLVSQSRWMILETYKQSTIQVHPLFIVHPQGATRAMLPLNLEVPFNDDGNKPLRELCQGHS